MIVLDEVLKWRRATLDRTEDRKRETMNNNRIIIMHVQMLCHEHSKRDKQLCKRVSVGKKNPTNKRPLNIVHEASKVEQNRGIYALCPVERLGPNM
jgi:hypothetical protein